MENKKENRKSKLLRTLFVIYCILLVWIILFKLSFFTSRINHIRRLNFEPFKYAYDAEIIENILMFIPMGIYLKMFGINNIKSILYGLGTSFLMEFLQYVFAIGISDLTDLINNTLGTVIGVFVYVIISKIFKNSPKIDKLLKILAMFVTVVVIVSFFILFVYNS